MITAKELADLIAHEVDQNGYAYKGEWVISVVTEPKTQPHDHLDREAVFMVHSRPYGSGTDKPSRGQLFRVVVTEQTE